MAILMKRSFIAQPLVALSLLVALSPLATAQAQERIGVAVSSINDVQGTMGQGQDVHKIVVGANLLENEIIITGEKSSTQLLFLDETTLTIGENSKLMLDELVYDPNDSMKISKMVLTPLVGVMRFASGTSDKEAYTVKTNVGTIGVRGTVFSVLTEPETTTVVLERGAVIMTNLNGVSGVLKTPGLSMSLVKAKQRTQTQQAGPPPIQPPPTRPAPPPATVAARVAKVVAPERTMEPTPVKSITTTTSLDPITRTSLEQIGRAHV